jgi:hypothetical protein
MRGRFNRTICNTGSGAVVPYALLDVFIQGGTVRAELYSAETGGAPIANPVEANSLGQVGFFVGAGIYHFVASTNGGAVVSEIEHEVIVDPNMAVPYSAWGALAEAGGDPALFRSAIGLNVYTVIDLGGSNEYLQSVGGNQLVYYRMTSSVAKSFIVRPNATHAVGIGEAFNIRNMGAGLLSISPMSGVTINAPAGGTLTVALNGSVTLICVALNTYDLIGQVVAA